MATAEARESIVYRSLKRAADIVAAALGLIVFGPLLAVLAVAIRATMGSPVLFRQERPGLHGKPFIMYKFRSMREAHDNEGRPLPDTERVTSLGRLIRKTSLDELPELWNVLKGDMSIVGPRPLLMAYMTRYTPEQHGRHDVRPGITGWAQVNGRNALSWEDKIAHDLEYVKRLSLSMDCLVILRTIGVVFSQRGIDFADTG